MPIVILLIIILLTCSGGASAGQVVSEAGSLTAGGEQSGNLSSGSGRRPTFTDGRSDDDVSQLRVPDDATRQSLKDSSQSGSPVKTNLLSVAAAGWTAAIPVRLWTAGNDMAPKAVLVCVHGLGLNSECYDDFARRVAKRGLIVYAMDVRGFGLWQEKVGKAKIDFKETLSDVGQVLSYAKQAHPQLPLFLLGESMGGAIVLQATAAYPDLMDGTVASVPANDRFHAVRTDMKVALEALRGPRHKFAEGKQVVDQATKNPQLREGWESDPVNRMDFSPEDLLQFQLFVNGNTKAARAIDRTPVLVFQGGRDNLIKPNGTVHLFHEIASPDKVLIVLGYSEHLMFEETQYVDPTQAVDHLVAWIDDHIPGANRPRQNWKAKGND